MKALSIIACALLSALSAGIATSNPFTSAAVFFAIIGICVASDSRQ